MMATCVETPRTRRTAPRTPAAPVRRVRRAVSDTDGKQPRKKARTVMSTEVPEDTALVSKEAPDTGVLAAAQGPLTLAGVKSQPTAFASLLKSIVYQQLA